MRFLLASLMFSFCALTGYAQDSTEETSEITTTEEGGDDVAAVVTDSHRGDGKCGCGGGGNKDGKPKI